MIHCQKIDFSPKLAATRIMTAKQAVGEAGLKRAIAFVLFVLGVERSQISEQLGIPPGTVRSVVRRVLSDGLSGLIDRRFKTLPNLPDPQEPQIGMPPSISLNEGILSIGGQQVFLAQDNTVQRKVLLLSLIGEGLLSTKEVALALGLSESHTRRLCRGLKTGDVEAVADKRQGQLHDYRVGSELKGQMIVQFVLELAENGQASSATVAHRLTEDCKEDVPERTVRHHLNRLGLGVLKQSLTEGLQALKKTPHTDCSGDKHPST